MKKTSVMGATLMGLMLSAQSGLATTNKNSAKAPTADTTMGECSGINSCKGKGSCGSAQHECSGKNSCKGKGWKELTKADCLKKKGKWAPSGSGMQSFDDAKSSQSTNTSTQKK